MKGSDLLSKDEGWPYKNLSKLAKDHGGPEKLLDNVFDAGEKQGSVKGGVYVLGAVAVAGGSYLLANYFKRREEKKKKQLYGNINEKPITDKPELNDSEENLNN